MVVVIYNRRSNVASTYCFCVNTVGGHYTAYALNPINHKWYEFDDASTHPVPDPKASIISSKAYVLFYMKRSLLNKLKKRARSANLPGRDSALPEEHDDLNPHAQRNGYA